MKNPALVMSLLLLGPTVAVTAPPLKFQKLTAHFWFLQMTGDQPNVGAFVGDEGILLINPPGEKDLAPVLDALKRVSARPVRWVITTDYTKERWGCPAPLREQGALLLASKAAFERSRSDGVATEAAAGPGSLFFGRQMRLFESAVEARIYAPQVKPPSTDIIVAVNAEKVLQAGAMFQPETFPQIEGPGTALAWIDSLGQVIGLVPLLKSAMPQPKAKPEPTKAGEEEEAKTLEESILVVPSRGGVSNLQAMKQLLEAAERVRSEVARAVKAGRNRDTVAGLASLAPYRNMANFETFVLRLYDDLAAR